MMWLNVRQMIRYFCQINSFWKILRIFIDTLHKGSEISVGWLTNIFMVLIGTFEKQA